MERVYSVYQEKFNLLYLHMENKFKNLFRFEVADFRLTNRNSCHRSPMVLESFFFKFRNFVIQLLLILMAEVHQVKLKEPRMKRKLV